MNPQDQNWVGELLTWFDLNKRSMPWRLERSAYRTWVSEMMLQQTQVITVIPYFNRFMEQFPTVHDLAKAHLDQVLKAWEGLGYYSRARNLHKAAKIVAENQGQLPTTYVELQSLPGIGPYIAAAIASIAFKEVVPVVDGNVLRVFARFWAMDQDIADPKTRKIVFDRLTGHILEQRPGDFNEAMMELGALLCKSQQPACDQCPLSKTCLAYQQNKVDEYPKKSKRAKVPHHVIGVGVIRKGDQVWIQKRAEELMLGGLWEFPGGKQEKGESIQDTIIREIFEETGATVQCQDEIVVLKHAYTHFKITLHAYFCELTTANLDETTAQNQGHWVNIENLNTYAFPKANQKILAYLK